MEQISKIVRVKNYSPVLFQLSSFKCSLPLFPQIYIKTKLFMESAEQTFIISKKINQKPRQLQKILLKYCKIHFVEKVLHWPQHF